MAARARGVTDWRKQNRPLVLLSGLSEQVVDMAVGVVRDWNWDLRATWITGFAWPTDKPVVAALIGDLPTAPVARRLLAEKCPVVRLGSLPHPKDHLLPAVLPDRAAFGRLAAEYFAARGFKDVAFVGYNPQQKNANYHAMFVGFRECAADHGMTCHLKSLAQDVDAQEPNKALRGIEVMADWLRELPKPVGLCSYRDFMMLRAFLACNMAGLVVPEEVALLGCGNRSDCELTPMRLSSIDIADDLRITTALQLLRRMMAGEPAPKEPIMVPPRRVVERASTNVLAVPDLAIARAIRFVWDHFDQNLSIQDIAQAAGIPRRSLERGFRQHLNRSVHEELGRKRVTELCRLLLATNAPLADLAPQAGFFTLVSAQRSFRRTFGVSPGRYRAQYGGVGRATRRLPT